MTLGEMALGEMTISRNNPVELQGRNCDRTKLIEVK